MNIPKFKPSRRFMDDLKTPCQVAKLRNSQVPTLARSHIAEFKEDPPFRIYLRGPNTKQVSPWQRKMLERLFVREELIEAISQGMKEFATSPKWCGYEDGTEIQRHGILACLYLNTIVIDETHKEVVLGLGTLTDGNLDEHGIAIHLTRGRWRFDYADYWSQYDDRVREEIGQPWPVEKWSPMDPSVLYGRWVFDEALTTARMKSAYGLTKRDGLGGMVLGIMRGWSWEISKGRVVIREGNRTTVFRLLDCKTNNKTIDLTLQRRNSKQVDGFQFELKNGQLLFADYVFRPNRPLNRG